MGEVTGFAFTVTVFTVLPVHPVELIVSVTLTDPEPAVVQVTETELLFCPAAIDPPVIVQL